MYMEPQWNTDKPITLQYTESTIHPNTLTDYSLDDYGVYYFSANKQTGILIPWNMIKSIRFSRAAD